MRSLLFTIALTLAATQGASAQTPTPLRIACNFGGGVVDVWVIDIARSTARFAGWPEPGIPASISEDALAWRYEDREGGMRYFYYVNRFTGNAQVEVESTRSSYRNQNLGRCEQQTERAF